MAYGKRNRVSKEQASAKIYKTIAVDLFYWLKQINLHSQRTKWRYIPISSILIYSTLVMENDYFYLYSTTTTYINKEKSSSEKITLSLSLLCFFISNDNNRIPWYLFLLNSNTTGIEFKQFASYLPDDHRLTGSDNKKNHGVFRTSFSGTNSDWTSISSKIPETNPWNIWCGR